MGLLLLEAALRLLGYQPRHVYVTDYFWVDDAELGFRNRANGTYINDSILGSPKVTTDASGFRTSYGPSPRAAPTIVFVGDSTAFNSEVEDDETIASEIAKSLGGQFAVLNAGVRGYSTVQSRLLLEQILKTTPRVAAVVYIYCSNDFVENVNPVVYYPMIAAHARLDQEGSLKIIRPRELRIHKTSSNATSEFWNDVLQTAKRHSALVTRAHTLYVVKRGLGGKVRLEDGSVGPLISDTPLWKGQLQRARQQGADQILVELLRQMRSMSDAANAGFLVVPFTRGEDKFEVIKDAIARANVDFLDVTDDFRKAGDPVSFAAKESSGNLDGHYNSKGTRVFAQALLPTIRTMLH